MVNKTDALGGSGAMRRSAWGLLLIVVLTVAAACGGGGRGKDRNAGGATSGTTATTKPATPPTAAGYIDALTKASMGNGMGDQPKINHCFAQSYVNTVGVKALASRISVDKLASETGVTPDQLGILLTPAQRDAFFAGIKTCSNPKTYFVDIFSSGNHLDAADKACLAAVVDDKILRTMLVAPFDGDTTPVEQTQDMSNAFSRIGTACPHIASTQGF